MDATPNPGDPGLVRCIIVCSPLQGEGLGRAFFKSQNITRIGPKAPREIRGAGKGGKNLGSRAAERAMTRKVPRKCWRHKVRSLIRNPAISMHPLHAAVLSRRIGRWTRPGENCDFPGRKPSVAS